MGRSADVLLGLAADVGIGVIDEQQINQLGFNLIAQHIQIGSASKSACDFHGVENRGQVREADSVSFHDLGTQRRVARFDAGRSANLPLDRGTVDGANCIECRRIDGVTQTLCITTVCNEEDVEECSR